MALVNNHEVIIAPVYMFEVEAVALAGLTRKVGMIENIIAQTVSNERVVDVVAAVCNPVVVKFLRAEYEN